MTGFRLLLAALLLLIASYAANGDARALLLGPDRAAD